MDIIKNKKEEFTVIDFGKVMSNQYHYFKNKEFWSGIDYGVVKCRLYDLSIDDAQFSVTSIENIDDVVKTIISALIDKIMSYRDKKMSQVHVMFDNYTFWYCNEKTPLNDHIDAEVEKLRKSSFRTRIKNYLLKKIIYIKHEEIDKTVELSVTHFLVNPQEEAIEVIVDKFPITDVWALNSILNKYRFEDSIFFDEEVVHGNEYMRELLNWELRCDSGYHNHDGDFAEYSATFIGPNGTEYHFETEMSLMGDGWDIQEGEYDLTGGN